MRLFPYTNSSLFSNHYLENRVKQHREWQEDATVQAAFERLKALYSKEKELLRSYNEAQLEKNFIQPILEKVLGHFFEVQERAHKSPRRPDYAFFPDDKSKREALKHKGKEDFYKKTIAVGDAKALGTPLSKKTRSREAYTYENPSLKIDIYLRETPPEWGILTDGQYWRLYYEKTSHKLDSYFEIDLFDVIARDDLESFKYFYLFFRREAFIKDHATAKCFLDRVYEGSIEYAKELGEELKQNVYEALKVLAQGFLDWQDNHLRPDQETLETIRANSLVLLYRLLFVFYAESRGLLNKDHPYYSLDSLKKEIADKWQRGERIEKWTPNYWNRLKGFFGLINEGSEARGIPKKDLFIPPYNGGLFDPKENQFLEQKVMGDYYLAQVIDLLARARTGGEDTGFVDYSTLDIRHLGSIYEGLLEYKLKLAQEDLVAVKEKGKEKWIPLREFEGDPARVDEDRKVKAGNLYLATDKGERKATGSYYTPDYIVKYIVKNTLGSLLEEKKKLAGDDPEKLIEEIYKIRVLDPAMGSGHFLVDAIDFLARALVEVYGASPKEVGDDDIRWARREIVERCIFGVDLNPLAVELAKLSLWLATVAKDKPLSFLDHHLRCGNSLIGATIKNLAELPELDRKKKHKKGSAQQLTLFEIIFKQHINELLKDFEQIESLPSETVGQIDDKEKLYASFRQKIERFKVVADIWTSTYFGNELSWSGYNALQEGLKANEHEWQELTKKEWFQKGVQLAEQKRFFHWELEFPEVFFDRNGQRLPYAGFSTVVGNPPYQFGEIIPSEIRTISDRFEFAVGQFDTYWLFYERIIKLLLRRGGLHGFIVPDAILARDDVEVLRKPLLADFTMKNVAHVGPVFEDPNVSAAVLVWQKSPPDRNQVRLGRRSNESVMETRSELQENFALIPGFRLLVYLDSLSLSLLVRILKGSVPLGSLVDISRGEELGKSVLKDITCSQSGDVPILVGDDVVPLGYPTASKCIPGNLVSKAGQTYSSPKIVFVKTGSTVVATLEKGDLVTLQSIYNLRPKPGMTGLAYVAAVLKGSLLSWFARKSFTEYKQLFPQFNQSTVQALPIRRISFTTPPDRRASLVQEAKALYSKYLNTQDSKKILDFVSVRLDAKPEESDVIHDLLAFLAEQMIEMNKEKHEEIKGFLNWLGGYLRVKIDELKNKTKIREYYKGTVEQLFEVLEQNRRNITKVNIRGREAREQIKAEFEKSIGKLRPLEEKIEATDKLIDQIVYKLYSLTDEEIKIVEGSLNMQYGKSR